MKKIFINYSWEFDSKNADKIYSALSKFPDHLSVWMDKKNLPGGLKWRPAIRKAIREADYFVSLLSSKSVKGRGVRNTEIYEAIDVLREFPPSETYLIPARIDECVPPFEEMNDLNWINLFPDWDEGIKNLVSAVNIMTKSKKAAKKRVSKIKNSQLKYHYRIGVIDLDMGLTNIDSIIEQLNKVQSYFLFTKPDMPRLRNTTAIHGGRKQFSVAKVPKSYIAEHPHLAIDLAACITKYPLSFVEGNNVWYNYFAGPSDQDERFLFLSADYLYDFCKEAKCLFEEGLVYILCGQLVNYFTKTNYHPVTRGCIMDFCENRIDIVKGLKTRKLCNSCNKNFPDGDLKDAIMTLLAWRYK